MKEIVLRPYQNEALWGAVSALRDHGSALISMPTGCGKTIIFAKAASLASKRTMIIAHREELVRQAADKVRSITGEPPDIEMADERACEVWRKLPVVVASVQTLNASRRGISRMEKFVPNDFSLLVVDEAHHAVAKTYRNIIDHFRQNEGLKVLGVTATPDRSDGKAMARVFDAVAYRYELPDAIKDGWLVPIKQKMVRVQNLDLRNVRRVAGDLHQSQLAEIMESERVLHEVVIPTVELCGDQRTLVFASSVAHAERICEIINRYKSGVAGFVCGTTPKEDRRQIIDRYRKGGLQYLVNVGIATEGFDVPEIGAVVVARPTLSRALYTQMVGRGTRPSSGLVDGLPLDADSRRAAIAASSKPSLLVLDFVGNSGRHRLVSAVDILAGSMSDRVKDKARARVVSSEEPLEIMECLDDAADEVRTEREKEQMRRKRSGIQGEATWTLVDINPFDVLKIKAKAASRWNSKLLTDGQRASLERQGVNTVTMPSHEQRQLFMELMRRRNGNLCTYKQARILHKNGYETDMNFDEASEILSRILG